MNKKTAARMTRAARVFERLQRIADREIKHLEKIKHIKPEDFRAAVALREVSDLCGHHGKSATQPHQPNLLSA